MPHATDYIPLPSPAPGFQSLERSIFVLSALIIALTFTIGAPVLNLFVSYTVSGGSFFSKFHPASALSIPLLAFILTDSLRNCFYHPIPWHIIIATTLIAIIIFILAARGRGALAANFIDLHLTTGILLLAFSRLSIHRVRALIRLFLLVAAANIVIVFVEFSMHHSLLPRENFESIFRPAGIFAHPIVAGTLFYIAMLLIDLDVIPFNQARWLFASHYTQLSVYGLNSFRSTPLHKR